MQTGSPTRFAGPEQPGGPEFLCDGVECAKDGSATHVTVHAARITLEENDRPSFSSPPAGTLFDSGKVSGTRTMSFVATDVGSGVRKVTVESSALPGAPLASKVLDSGNGRCAAAKFTYTVPCPLSIDDELTVDTLQFPDGPQTVTVTIEDAAGNTKSATRTIDVKNAPASTRAPAVTGIGATIGAGDTLACDPGTFEPAPQQLAYQWLIDGWPVAGADHSTYTMRTADVGHSLVCRVSATRGGGTTTVDSAPVGGSGQPGGTPVGPCTGQPTGPTDPCGDFDGDGVRNADDADDDNDGTPDTTDVAPFDPAVTKAPQTGSDSTGGSGGSGGNGANGGTAAPAARAATGRTAARAAAAPPAAARCSTSS